MSNNSNDFGRGYEYACINMLKSEISNHRPCQIIENSSYHAAKNAWDNIDQMQKEVYLISAMAMIDTLFEFEPLIIENDDDLLELLIQPDTRGEEGDVRDILLIRCGIDWEIGLSVKHNHFAVKHSRLAKNLDFGKKWFGIECSNEYWNEIRPIFDYLEESKQNGLKWSELEDKENDVYVPLLNAFMNEIERSNSLYSDIPKKMVEYLLGEYDFYKVISIDQKSATLLQSYNLHGTLNHRGNKITPKRIAPIVSLPDRIVSLDFKPNSNNTVELYLNNGWQFSFRIHNASTYVETSLKFDIQIIGMPTTIITVECQWQ